MYYSPAAIAASVCGVLAMASGAIAQTVTPTNLVPAQPTSQPTVDIPFEGRVETACSFDIPDPGSLVPVGIPIADVLTSLEPGGNPGQVNIICNAGSNLTVNEPVQTGGPSVVTTAEESRVSSPYGDTRSSGVPLTVPPGVVVPLTVDMSVRSDNGTQGFPPGVYRYKVTLVVTP